MAKLGGVGNTGGDLSDKDRYLEMLKQGNEMAAMRAQATRERAVAEDAEYYAKGVEAYEQGDFELTYRALVTVRTDTSLVSSAAPMLAHSRFQIAAEYLGQRREQGLRYADFRPIFLLMKQAREGICEAETAQVIEQHQLSLVREFINATFTACIESQAWPDADAMLTALMQLSDVEEEREWAETQLGVLCANRAIEKINSITTQRQRFLNNIGGQ